MASGTRDAVLAIKGEDDLFARWRNIGRPGDARLQVLVATVNGISAGIQNTG